ncbi:MAG: integration host factor subunit alpha [Rickettsiales bacterium]|jgi:integration host factor subunit alpha|nr:integration host factor subunit alpha [Rickettsiales bacterium]
MKKTVTKIEIAKHLSETIGLSLIDSKNIVNDVFERIKQGLLDAETVKIADFGTFAVKQKKERIGRNPKTGVEAVISARKVVSFKPSDKLKK